MSSKPRLAIAFASIAAALLSLLSLGVAIASPIPDKTEWKKKDGTVIRGQVHKIGTATHSLARHGGKFYLNAQPISRPASDPLLLVLCKKNKIPVTDRNRLEKLISAFPRNQMDFTYFTLQYRDEAGEEMQVPIDLLADEEQEVLKPAVDLLLAELQAAERNRIEEERKAQIAEARLRMFGPPIDREKEAEFAKNNTLWRGRCARCGKPLLHEKWFENDKPPGSRPGFDQMTCREGNPTCGGPIIWSPAGHR